LITYSLQHIPFNSPYLLNSAKFLYLNFPLLSWMPCKRLQQAFFSIWLLSAPQSDASHFEGVPLDPWSLGTLNGCCSSTPSPESYVDADNHFALVDLIQTYTG